jgi:hypothetical protein
MSIYMNVSYSIVMADIIDIKSLVFILIEAFNLLSILYLEVIHESFDSFHQPSVDEDLAVLIDVFEHN